MTLEEFRRRTRELEEKLEATLEDLHNLSEPPARVVEILVLEPYHDRDDETARNQAVEIKLDRSLPADKKSSWEEDILALLEEYEGTTGFRVTAVLLGKEDSSGYPVEVRVDPLAYPQRLLQIRQQELEEGIEDLLHDFTSATQTWVEGISLAQDDELPESYKVRAKLGPSIPEEVEEGDES